MWSKYVDAMLTATPIARSGLDQMRNSDQIVTQSAQIGSFLPSHSTPSHLPQFSALGVDLWIRALLQKGAVCARQRKVRQRCGGQLNPIDRSASRRSTPSLSSAPQDGRRRKVGVPSSSEPDSTSSTRLSFLSPGTPENSIWMAKWYFDRFLRRFRCRRSLVWMKISCWWSVVTLYSIYLPQNLIFVPLEF